MANDAAQAEFHMACSIGHDGLVVEYLQTRAVSVVRTTGGRTPLLETCWKGHARTAAILISAGSDVNATDEEDFSCMHAAALHGFAEILDLLLRHGANLEALDDGLSTPFGMAAFDFHRDAMRLLADRGANLSPVARDNVTPLNFACIMGNDAKARLLLELGEDNGSTAQAGSGGGRPRNAVLTPAGHTCLPQVIGYMWQSPPAPDLLRESAQGRAPECAWGRHLAIAEMLVAAGASLDRVHVSTLMAPLHLAAGIGSRRLMTALLRAGADTSVAGRPPDGVFCVPLSWAAACSRPLMVRLLLQGGALETDVDERGRPPLMVVGSYVSSLLPPAPQEEVEARASAVTLALLRGPAFRARSFLWPASSASGRRCGQGGRPAALRGMWRCVFLCSRAQ